MLAADGVDYGSNTLRVAPAAIAAAYGDAPTDSTHYVVQSVPVGTLETYDPPSARWKDPTQPPTSGAPSNLLASLRSRVVSPTTPVRWTAPNIDATTSLPLQAMSWDGNSTGTSSYLNVTAPGVYIHEVAAYNSFVTVPTGIPLFLGTATSPTPGPVMLTQASDLSTMVPEAGEDLTQAVDYFFANGGTQATVVATVGADAGSLTAALASLPASIEADLVVVPAMGSTSGSDYLAIATAMVAAAARVQGTALLDPPTTLVQQAAADPSTHGAALAAVADQIRGAISSPANAAIYSSPLVGPTPYGATPASVAAAVVIAQTDASVGTWGSPAGMRAVLPSRPLLEPSIELAGSLNFAGMNPIMIQEGVPVIWGGHTLATELPQRFLSNARTLETISKSIQQGLASYTFQPNDGQTWASVSASISSYLTTLWTAGVLFGSRPSDAFTVQVGLGTTMTAQDILNGVMRVNVSLAVMQPDVFVEQSFEQAMPG